MAGAGDHPAKGLEWSVLADFRPFDMYIIVLMDIIFVCS